MRKRLDLVNLRQSLAAHHSATQRADQQSRLRLQHYRVANYLTAANPDAALHTDLNVLRIPRIDFPNPANASARNANDDHEVVHICSVFDDFDKCIRVVHQSG